MILLGTALLIIPFLVNFGIEHWPFHSAGKVDAWIGFWGSYIGIVSSATITIAIFLNQRKNDILKSEKEIEIHMIDLDKNRGEEFLKICNEIRDTIREDQTKQAIMNVMHDVNRILKLSASKTLRKDVNTLFSEVYKIYKKFEDEKDKVKFETIDYSILQFKIRDLEDSITYLQYNEKK